MEPNMCNTNRSQKNIGVRDISKKYVRNYTEAMKVHLQHTQLYLAQSKKSA
jgi:hypothetical protein